MNKYIIPTGNFHGADEFYFHEQLIFFFSNKREDKRNYSIESLIYNFINFTVHASKYILLDPYV